MYLCVLLLVVVVVVDSLIFDQLLINIVEGNSKGLNRELSLCSGRAGLNLDSRYHLKSICHVSRMGSVPSGDNAKYFCSVSFSSTQRILVFSVVECRPYG